MLEGYGASSLATDTARTNQLYPTEDDVIARRLRLGPISLQHPISI